MNNPSNQPQNVNVSKTKPNQMFPMKNKNTNPMFPLLCAGIFAIATTASHAQVIVDFNGNADGLLVGTSTSSSVGLSGNWGGGANVNGSGVTSLLGQLTSTYAIAQTGTAKMLASAAPSDVNSVRRATFGTPLSGTVYFSYLAQLTGSTDRLGLTLNSAADVLGNAVNGGITLISVASAGTSSTVTAAQTRLWNNGAIIAASGGGTNPFTLTTPGAVNFTVGRITFNVSGVNDQIEFWVNPNLSGGTLGTANYNSGAAAGDLLGSSLTLFGVGIYGTTVGPDGTSGLVDNIRFGNSLSDVAVIPEPATFALLGIGMMTVLTLRRRRVS